jgi:hypothetical protein
VFIDEPCTSIDIPIRTRIWDAFKSLLGFIAQRPCFETNDNRYLVLYDDFSASYPTDACLHLCLCQDFHRHLLNFEYQPLRSYYTDLLDGHPSTKSSNHYRIGDVIRVKKFGGQFHNARILERDQQLLYICFYQRQSPKRMWIYMNSSIIEQETPSVLSMALSDERLVTKRKTLQGLFCENEITIDVAHHRSNGERVHVIQKKEDHRRIRK